MTATNHPARVRHGRPDDLARVARLLEAAPQAAQWLPEADPFLVAEFGDAAEGDLTGVLAGVLVWRAVAEGEFELLNLATHAGHRRAGVATRLVQTALSLGGTWFLEVRESNFAAQMLYRSAGFREAGRRVRYYTNPIEDAIVFMFQQC